jgi:HPt (histidine-containing phosphotransfer) domain-containing protein
MSTLRVLLVDADCHESARVVTLLSGANHSVLGAGDLKEATEALELQKFDAVLLGASVPSTAVPEFAASVRNLEQRQFGQRVPLFSISPTIAEEQGWSLAEESPLDGYLAEQFGPDTLTSAIRCLERGISLHSNSLQQQSPIFEPAEFEEQCGGEAELMAEIIDLFVIEQEHQLGAMRDALAAGEYERLSYVAHTLKGSLGSLHAVESRRWAECLEGAAKQMDGRGCSEALLSLQRALAALKPVILTFRTQLLAH